MRKTLLVVCALALLAAVPSLAFSDELKVAHRWAVGLQTSAFSGWLEPTVEYWPSENFGLAASLGVLFFDEGLAIRGTYLWNTPIHIFSMPARPYAGAGLGFDDYTVYSGVYGERIEAFGGLLQPITDRWSFRAELELGLRFVSWGENASRGYTPVSLGLGIFYHIPAK
jgi:hypothetical protein